MCVCFYCNNYWPQHHPPQRSKWTNFDHETRTRVLDRKIKCKALGVLTTRSLPARSSGKSWRAERQPRGGEAQSWWSCPGWIPHGALPAPAIAPPRRSVNTAGQRQSSPPHPLTLIVPPEELDPQSYSSRLQYLASEWILAIPLMKTRVFLWGASPRSDWSGTITINGERKV